MAITKRVEARLVQLEASVDALLDREAEREKLITLHYETWLLGGSLEDIPEKDRDLELWEYTHYYGPVILELI